MPQFNPKQLFIHPSVADHPVTKKILAAVPDVTAVVQNSPDPITNVDDPVGAGKRIWFLTRSPGQLVKECPATPVQLCCRYRVINVITNCPIDCSYCILQGYLNNPFITMYVNLEDIKSQVRTFLATEPHHIFRFGTGELSDSLALEHCTGFSRDLALFFQSHKNAFFEIKTKSHHVESLLDLDPQGAIGVSWSVNPEDIIRKEELGASSLSQRLEAARRCQDQGYLIGFHFDPIILNPDWEEKYYNVVRTLFTALDPSRMTWISLGGFRYPSFLKPVIKERFPQTTILTGELFPGPDGKYRYFKTLRVDLYKKIVHWIRSFAPDMFIYFCMESPEVWLKVFGECPDSRDDLDKRFAERIRQLRE